MLTRRAHNLPAWFAAALVALSMLGAGRARADVLDGILEVRSAYVNIEQGVFQKEDIHCAIGIQQGLKTGANTHLTVGRMEQAPACINVLDVGPGDMVVRAVNLAPTQWLHERERHTTMEKLLAQFLRVEALTARG